jgi:hypothetical protein
MIKASANNGTLIIIGLSRKNVEALQAGRPIDVGLSEMGMGDKRLVILFGETEESLMKDLMGEDNPTVKVSTDKPQ